MADEKRRYTDRDGENTVHMFTPFAYRIGADYDYLLAGPVKTALTAAFRFLVLAVLYPWFLALYGLRIRGRARVRALRDSGAVFVCNHVHVMDSPMASEAIGLRRTYSVTLASNFCIPVVRHLVRGLGGVPLTGEPEQLIRLFAEMETALRAGKAVLIYPEGVLAPRCETLRPFKRGAFLLAARAGVPVVPMRLLFREPRGLRRLLGGKPPITLEVLPPVSPDASLPLRARSVRLQEECRAAMEAAK